MEVLEIQGKSTTGLLIWLVSLSIFIANPRAHITLISILCLVELNRLLRRLDIKIYLSVMVLSILYIGVSISIYLGLYRRFGVSVLILISCVAVLSDSFSYIAGTFFTRQQQKNKEGWLGSIYKVLCYKPAPISPNKTLVGFIFAGIGGMMGIVCLKLISGTFLLVFKWPAMAKLLSVPNGLYGSGFILGLAGQAGDLIESSVKRLCKVKDSGSILAEHGGICDRYDSTFSIVYATYTVLLFRGCI